MAIARASRLLVGSIAAAFAALSLACTVPPPHPPLETSESATPAGSQSSASSGDDDDTADTACAPNPPAKFVAAYHPTPANQGMCSEDQIRAFYESCFGANLNMVDCVAWVNAFPGCEYCLTSSSTPTYDGWGPFLAYPTKYELNVGGCLAIRLAPQTLCAEAIEENLECEHAACDPSCGETADESPCLDDADTGACALYAQRVTSECAGVGSSPCFETADPEASFVRIASAFCE